MKNLPLLSRNPSDLSSVPWDELEKNVKKDQNGQLRIVDPNYTGQFKLNL